MLKNIHGAATARRVGTDALSPTFAQLLPMAFPNAELVDGGARAAGRPADQDADEIARAARRARRRRRRARGGRVAELAPGVTEQALTGVMMEAMAAGGVTTPATQDGAWITPRPLVASRSGATAGSPTAIWSPSSAGALADGYVGEVGRTWPVGDVPGADALFRRSNELWERLVAACRPGGRPATCSPRTRRPANRCPRCRSRTVSASGFDPPVISPDLPTTCAEERLDPGMVLAVTGYVWEPGVGAVFCRDAVLITDDGAEVLTSSPRTAPSRRSA